MERFLNKPKPASWLLALAVLAAIILVPLLVRADAGLYSRAVGRVVQVRTEKTGVKTGTDGTHEYQETYYRQTLTLRLLNTKDEGRLVRAVSACTSSGVYDTTYAKGDDVFLDHVQRAAGTTGSGRAGSASGEASASAGRASAGAGAGGETVALTAVLGGTKRDWLIAAILTLLFGLFLLIGRREEALTILSLVLNMAAFFLVLHLYTQGKNILLMMIPVTVFFTAMLLFFMYGWNERSRVSFRATLLTLAGVTLLALLVIRFCPRIDYDFMDYLPQPYEQEDANLIFLSEIMVGCLGAVMDVVVTIVMTTDQIFATQPAGTQPDPAGLRTSLRTVGDDLVGTMISLMFFTNTAAGLPSFLLFLRNGIAFRTILRYNIFFGLARFLTGSIGVVLAIPLAAWIAIRHYRTRAGAEEKGGLA